ncbi:hypothetical protein [Anaerosporobacter faecicola]|uniref:hypothetical protein n=1 Tax=Anaerosporobacter faecicola TaxID=2718714 RepID=UPI001439B82D|nr:hypothetical protein [Anaerosporobacter faecicola]
MKLKKAIVTSLVFSFLISTQVFAAGQTSSQTLWLPENTWVGIYAQKTTTAQKAYSRCTAVYPSSGDDNYTRVKSRCSDATGYTCISAKDEYVLYETATGYTTMTFANYVSKGTYFIIDYKGNNPELAAYADVECDFN